MRNFARFGMFVCLCFLLIPLRSDVQCVTAGDKVDVWQRYKKVKMGMSLKEAAAILGNTYGGVTSLGADTISWHFEEGNETTQTIVVHFDQFGAYSKELHETVRKKTRDPKKKK